MLAKKLYRPSVLGVFQDTNNKVLIAARSDNGAWQFPQGGIEDGESPKEALYREMKEELGSNQFDIISASDQTYYYDFPPDLKKPIALQYKGQKQLWFLCRFHKGHQPNLLEATDKEFCQTRWVETQEALESVVEWKLSLYQQGLKGLGLID
mgnify:CR=1 FL=1